MFIFVTFYTYAAQINTSHGSQYPTQVAQVKEHTAWYNKNTWYTKHVSDEFKGWLNGENHGTTKALPPPKEASNLIIYFQFQFRFVQKVHK